MTLRQNPAYLNVSDSTLQYVVAKKTYFQQFSQIYYCRLYSLKPAILKHAASSGAEGVNVRRILDVEVDRDSLILGTVYCENVSRPNIFEEIETNQISNLPRDREVKLVHGPPLVYLEDESGRIELDVTQVSSYFWITGITIGVRGLALASGKFLVREVVEPGLAPQKPLTFRAEHRYVLLLSGLNYESSDPKSALARNLLLDFVNGHIQPELSSKIVRVVLAGNTMSLPIKVANEFKKKYGHEVAKYRTDHLHVLDQELSNVGSACEVEIMPGEYDLSSVAMPQRPVPKSLFPGLSALESVKFSTNPNEFEIDAVRFIGVSGQSIDDCYRHTHTEDRLELAEKTLSWRLLCPTAPDSLPSYPFYDKDPYVLSESPHVYFIGNQPSFSWRKVQGPNGETISVVLLPEFSKSHVAALVDLSDLSVHSLRIGQ